ncbi:MAG: DNA-directed RNA polymerase subunit beta [Planctomycetes bacterium]|nr:DNA-directed RNA polymerase subunit beta [Planctomycetota bacterium]
METKTYKRYHHSSLAPDLASIQLMAYERFLQRDVLPSQRKNTGLEAIFRDSFQLKSYDGTVSLEYLWYEIGQPRYTPDECRALKITYGAPIKVRLRLNRPDPVEEYVYLGDIPLMIGGGEFIVNGIERIIVSQLHRSPGIDFKEEKVGDRKFHSAWIIPEHGSWIEISVSKKNSAHIKIDQGGKIPITTFLRAIDESMSSNTQLIKIFLQTEFAKIGKDTTAESLLGRYVAVAVVNPQTNTTIIEAGGKITEEIAKFLAESQAIKEIELINFGVPVGEEREDLLILNTFLEDTTHSHEEALLKIYNRLKPGMPPNVQRAKTVFQERFFDKSRYQLGRVGRFRINRRFGLSIPETEQTLMKDDVIGAIKYLIKLGKGEGIIDDIDHLGNRRVRLIDELASDEIRKGFYRLQRLIRERLSSNLVKKEEMTPRTVVNSKTISAAINYFFERGELSQVVDQTNPLSQITHERRLSALGPGGLNRKRAGFEVRDVHSSHYGRICPVETPEGANIGLITSLATYAQIDKYGFITTPYRPVKNAAVSDDIVYLRADEELNQIIAPSDVNVQNNHISGDSVLARYNGEFKFVKPAEVNYIDVSPFQIIGVSAGLIPFLEHDDANRALMGSNMQRQAVPLLITEPPLIKTGLEKYVAENSAMVVRAAKTGIVTRVDANQIIIKTASAAANEDDEDGEYQTYHLRKYEGLNEKTCMNQVPMVKTGDKVKAGQVIADGPATAQGELALGKNITVAFMTWEGYNFEDAIILSERCVKDDIFTSIHIEDFEVEIRETKFGREEFTRDIPNVPEKNLRNLDESGIIRIGTRVRYGDILVGKISPKSKSELTPEEKLLHAIFGKAGEDVKNESLEASPGIDGIVIDTQHFARTASQTPKQKDEVARATKKIERDINAQLTVLIDEGVRPIEKMAGKRLLPRPISFGARGTVKSINDLRSALNLLSNIQFSGKAERLAAETKASRLVERCEKLENEKDIKINKALRGDDLPPGVLEMVRVRVATKRNLSVGDKLAGRHGNKGVVARILPEEEMPFTAEGRPVDILLNPLGVPSRMNVGQILETHLGWISEKLGIKIVSPIFDGVTEDDINRELKSAGLPEDGKMTLYDGRTGEPFKERVTVGNAYIMKLHHLVDDKIHARATGPYSLITQQPLGGKARYGGQRLGEMEVWALEAYGAANVLQEMLTVKSDDVDGRTKIYEACIKGENTLEPGTPVSFEVLVNEIKGLGLALKLEKDKEVTKDK